MVFVYVKIYFAARTQVRRSIKRKSLVGKSVESSSEVALKCLPRKIFQRHTIKMKSFKMKPIPEIKVNDSLYLEDLTEKKENIRNKAANAKITGLTLPIATTTHAIHHRKGSISPCATSAEFYSMSTTSMGVSMSSSGVHSHSTEDGSAPMSQAQRKIPNILSLPVPDLSENLPLLKFNNRNSSSPIASNNTLVVPSLSPGTPDIIVSMDEVLPAVDESENGDDVEISEDTFDDITILSRTSDENFLKSLPKSETDINTMLHNEIKRKTQYLMDFTSHHFSSSESLEIVTCQKVPNQSPDNDIKDEINHVDVEADVMCSNNSRSPSETPLPQDDSGSQTDSKNSETQKIGDPGYTNSIQLIDLKFNRNASISEGKGIYHTLLKTKAKEKRRQAKAKETRATLIVGLIMGAFILSWLPFFVLYVVQALCPLDTCFIPTWSFKIAFWLGYSNSAFNPIIYTIFNQNFRRAFKKILFIKSFPKFC